MSGLLLTPDCAHTHSHTLTHTHTHSHTHTHTEAVNVGAKRAEAICINESLVGNFGREIKNNGEREREREREREK